MVASASASASSSSGWKWLQWADSVSIVGCGNPFKLGLPARQTFLLGYVSAGLIYRREAQILYVCGVNIKLDHWLTVGRK